MQQLKYIDKKIVYELEKNSRQSLSKIARRLKTSQQVVSYRLKKLDVNNTINKYITIIDYCCLGYNNVLIGVKIKNTENYSKILSYFIDNKQISYVCETSGMFSFFFSFLYKTSSSISNCLYEIKKILSNSIIYYKLYFVSKTRLFNKDYFFEDYRNINNEITIDSNKKRKIIDVDKKILKEISEDSRIRTTDIAKKINEKPETIVKRLKILYNLNIILRYSIFVNTFENSYFLFVSLKTNRHKDFIDYIKNTKNVVCVYQVIGEQNLVIKYENFIKDIQTEVLKIQNDFYNVVESIEIVLLNKENKLDFCCL
jgi:DNA-binding Lrp family transcriptional regulator